MDRKSVIVNCVGFIITFSLVVLTLAMYNEENRPMLLSYAGGGYDIEENELMLADYEFVDIVEFNTSSVEQYVAVYSGVSDLAGLMFSVLQSNSPIYASVRLTGKNGEVETYESELPLEEGETFGYYLRKGVVVELLITPSDSNTAVGQLKVYYIKN